MSYRIRWSSAALRAIENTLPKAIATAVWKSVNGALAENPHRVGKPLLRELVGYRSAHRGQYRVVYAINDDEIIVTVVAVDHRRDVYR